MIYCSVMMLIGSTVLASEFTCSGDTCNCNDIVQHMQEIDDKFEVKNSNVLRNTDRLLETLQSTAGKINREKKIREESAVPSGLSEVDRIKHEGKNSLEMLNLLHMAQEVEIITQLVKKYRDIYDPCVYSQYLTEQHEVMKQYCELMYGSINVSVSLKAQRMLTADSLGDKKINILAMTRSFYQGSIARSARERLFVDTLYAERNKLIEDIEKRIAKHTDTAFNFTTYSSINNCDGDPACLEVITSAGKTRNLIWTGVHEFLFNQSDRVFNP